MAVILRASFAVQLPTDVGLVSVQHLGNLRFIVYVFNEGVNPIIFSSAEVFSAISNLDCQVKKP